MVHVYKSLNKNCGFKHNLEILNLITPNNEIVFNEKVILKICALQKFL